MHRGLWKHWEGLQTQNEGLKQILEMVMFNLRSIDAWVDIGPADNGKKDIVWKRIEVSEYVVFWKLQLVASFVDVIADEAGGGSRGQIRNVVLEFELLQWAR